MTEKDVFQFYNDVVKVIYCEVEARNNTSFVFSCKFDFVIYIVQRHV